MIKTLNEELNRLTVEEFQKAQKLPVVVVLDNIRSQSNIGSFFRTGDAFLIEKIYLCGITATPPHREIQKTALGATETVTWEYSEKTNDCINQLKKQGYTIIAVEQVKCSVSLADFQPRSANKLALIFGNELNGVDQSIVDLCDGCLEIPQSGTKHSLNVSVAGGIVLWKIYSELLISH
ncbi:MAG: RNA methyltransferase [Bacteroidetes bacterium HGW-Bacteroidetes-22]|nr:MAG: RNA methyltransferase [Bacteroidetes bacterium HGW-Bacteroidetes-22]